MLPTSSLSSHCYRHYFRHIAIVITLLSSRSFSRHRHRDSDDCITNIIIIIITLLCSLPLTRPHHHHIVIIMIFVASSSSSSSSHHYHHHLCRIIIIAFVTIASPTSSSSSHCYRHYLRHIHIVSASFSSRSFLRHLYRDSDDCITNVVIITITLLWSLPPARPHCHYIVFVMIFVASLSLQS